MPSASSHARSEYEGRNAVNDLQQVNTQYEMKVTKVRVPSGGVFLAGDLAV